MYCNYCGKTIPEDANLCAYCGKRVAGMIARERLVRPRQNRKIAGVCLGFAEFFGLDVTLVRIVWAICSICGGLGAAAYGVAWIIMPEEPLMLTGAAPAAQNQMINT